MLESRFINNLSMSYLNMVRSMVFSVAAVCCRQIDSITGFMHDALKCALASILQLEQADYTLPYNQSEAMTCLVTVRRARRWGSKRWTHAY